MKFVSWNLSYCNDTDKKLEYLKNIVLNDDFIMVLQEVLPNAFERVLKHFPNLQVEYSLNYRKPGKFDTRARMLGVVMIASKSISIKSANTLERTPFPDRTLVANCNYEGKDFSVIGLHSITGCDYSKTKSIQFYSFAEAVDAINPSIVAFDANEPQHDHISVQNMIFFDNKDHGNGARTFFNTMISNGLCESYSAAELTDKDVLPFSHRIKSAEKRYDFVFVDENLFSITDVLYDYENAKINGSDHAAVVVDAVLK